MEEAVFVIMFLPRALFRFISNLFYPRQKKRYLRKIEGTTPENQEVDERDFPPENLEIVWTSAKNQDVDERDFLPENLEKILHNLNVRDLCRAAAVNKLWNAVATRELKQRGLELAVIPVSDVNLYDAVRSKPYVAVIFVGRKVELGDLDWMRNLQFDVLKRYQNYFPKYLVVLGMDHLSVDEEFITCDEEMLDGSILSLLIPEYRDLKIRAAYINDDAHRPYQELLNEFLPEDTQSTATFIVFVQHFHSMGRLFKLLKRSMKKRQQKFTVWGGCVENGPFVAANGQIDLHEPDDYIHSISLREKYGCSKEIFAMSITASSLDSWSILISLETKKWEFEQELIAFRGQLQLRRRSIGLTCGYMVLRRTRTAFPTLKNIFSEKLDAVKEIFPEIPFIRIHDEDPLHLFYGMKYGNEDSQTPSESKMSLSLLILTFD